VAIVNGNVLSAPIFAMTSFAGQRGAPKGPQRRKQAEIRKQIRVSQETVERSQELLGRIDDLLAKSPLL
jgi:hypothetical protein